MASNLKRLSPIRRSQKNLNVCVLRWVAHWSMTSDSQGLLAYLWAANLATQCRGLWFVFGPHQASCAWWSIMCKGHAHCTRSHAFLQLLHMVTAELHLC